MSTGDLRGCLRELDALLRAIKYPRDVDHIGLSKGDPSACLPIMNFAMASFSPLLSAQLVAAGLQLTGKNDLRFTDTAYKVLRDVFQYKPILSKQQFLQWGFSQRKISLICDVINLVLQRHSKLKKSSHPSYVVSCVEDFSSPRNSCSDKTDLSEDTKLSDGDKDDNKDASLVPAMAERILALETQLEKLLPVLDRFTALETRLEDLEARGDVPTNDGPFVTISREDWENLLSRVILLDTKLELTSPKTEVLGGYREGTRHTTTDTPLMPLGPPPSNPPSGFLSSVVQDPQDDLKNRLERINNMMKNTSSLLKSSEASICSMRLK